MIEGGPNAWTLLHRAAEHLISSLQRLGEGDLAGAYSGLWRAKYLILALGVDIDRL